MLIVSCAIIYDDAIRACAVSTVTADRTVVMGSSDHFYQLGPLSLVQQNKQIFFRVISFILAELNSNVTCYLPNTSTTYANVDHTKNTKL